MNLGRQRIRLVIAFMVAFIIQACYANLMQIHNARPNLAVLALLIGCMFVGANTAATFGFIVGLLEASFAAQDIGSIIVSRTLTAYIVGILEERIFRDNPVIAVATAFIGTFAVEGLFFLFAPQPHVLRWITLLIGECVYNTALAIPVYYLLRRVWKGKS